MKDCCILLLQKGTISLSEAGNFYLPWNIDLHLFFGLSIVALNIKFYIFILPIQK